MKPDRHWIFRHCGSYETLVEDLNRITVHNPNAHIINVQQIHFDPENRKSEWTIYTRGHS